MNSENMFKVW